jgi:hypothetical protein
LYGAEEEVSDSKVSFYSLGRKMQLSSRPHIGKMRYG